MKKVTLAMALALVLLLSTIGSASAITNGVPDNSRHPYVGLVVFDVPRRRHSTFTPLQRVAAYSDGPAYGGSLYGWNDRRACLVRRGRADQC